MTDLLSPGVDLERLREQHAERRALALLWRGITFRQCLKQQGIAPTIAVVTATGDTVTLRGSDLYDRRTWQKFLASLPHVVDLCSLTGTADALTKRYSTWVLTAWTSRYRALTSDEQLAWLERAASLAVIRHIMEQKVEQTRRYQRTAFVDPWVETQMCALMERSELLRDTARLIHRLVTEAVAAEELITKLADELERRWLLRPAVPHTALPPLPDGTALLPSVLLLQEKE